jgi:molybdopterin/thiamine biosynthesis adenylyltransferase
MTENRYARQTLIPGWDQERLAQARVGVIGCDWLGSLLAWGLAALGVGHIYLLDDRRVLAGDRTSLCLPQSSHKGLAGALAETLVCMNPAVTARALPVSLRYAEMAHAIPACDVLVDTSSEASQRISQAFAYARGVPLILATAGAAGGACSVHLPEQLIALPPQAEGLPGAAACLVMAGLILEEVRQLLLPLSQDAPMFSHSLGYNWSRANRFVSSCEIPAPVQPVCLPPGCLIVGAGALGTWVGLALTLAGASGLTIIDPDAVEAANLNRQVLYFDAIGKSKATVLAGRLNHLRQGTNARGIVSPVVRTHLHGAPLVFLCVDSFAVRAQVNGWVTRLGEGTTMINGGTSAFRGEVEVYRPGQTACLECRIDVSSLADTEANHRTRCNAMPEPSVVISNMITAGLMVGEACALAVGQPAFAGALEFDSSVPFRVGQLPGLPACACGAPT